MNIQDTLNKMLNAGAAAAKIHWDGLRGFAEQEFKELSQSGVQLEADYLADMAEAKLEGDPAKRLDMETKAKLRAQLSFESLQLATDGLITAARADAKIAAQDAINAALGVLKQAVNSSVGIPLL